MVAAREGVPADRVCLASNLGQVPAFYDGYMNATSELAGGNVVSSTPSYLHVTEAMAMYGSESLALNSELTDDLHAFAAQVLPAPRPPPHARASSHAARIDI